MNFRRLLSIILIFRVISLSLWVFIVAFIVFIAFLGAQRSGAASFGGVYVLCALVIAYYAFSVMLIFRAKKGCEKSFRILRGTLIFSGIILLILTVYVLYMAIRGSMITHPLAVYFLMHCSCLSVLYFLFAKKLVEAHKELQKEADLFR